MTLKNPQAITGATMAIHCGTETAETETETETKTKTKPDAETKSADRVEAWKNIRKSVEDSAESIINGLIEGAKAGHLASAKFLFDLTGVGPPPEQAEKMVAEFSLAHTLLLRMGLSLDPVVAGELVSTTAVHDKKNANQPTSKVAADAGPRQNALVAASSEGTHREAGACR